ncbi:tRNA (N6-isopentenyl adenosine(37)-C2)-methylthiotransferase MiaB [Buchnera aphidicola (Formosaphis micheliae)]|uniref:tRNA (N6-isopentenyl adenosine(37)-C2)-methylthiotransferase MiaB n=1 Tax=Buchnera aphidicola TaxID=9 RepID=UPI0031B89B02
MKKKVYIKTWGCQMNNYDSSIISRILKKENNYDIIDTSETADILILNTCSIREKAQEKVFHQLGRWKNLKYKNPNLIIAVGGCVATQEGEKIKERAKYVDIIFGTQTLHRLSNMIKNVHKSKNTVIDITFPKIEKFDYILKPDVSQVSAFVTIMEGCNKYCSFCIVPYTRGREISRPYNDILHEIYQLSKTGVKEINLLGQNVNAYKIFNKNGTIYKFSELLRDVAKIETIKRIRFTTSNPIEFTDDIIEVYKDTPKLVNYLHLPVQSGSDRILKLMKRSHTISEYKKIIKKILKIRPNIHISSDFIVGFPGETSHDFQKTLSLVREIKFDTSYSFLYSPRPGTPASKLLDNIQEHEKKQRLYTLQKLINQQTEYWNKKILHSTQSVLVEGISKKNIMKLSGRTDTNKIVHFTGSPKMIGTLVNLKITHYYQNSLKGELI